MTTKLALGMIAAATLLAGCMSAKRYHAFDSGHRELVPDMTALSDAEITKLRATPVAAREPAAAGIAWIVDAGGDGDGALPESERLALVRKLADALERTPFSTVDVLPTTSANGESREDSGELPALLSAATRFRHDVLIVVSTHRNQYDDWNPLAATYLVLLPRWFVPGDSLAVYASAEACAVDVVSGLFLACAQGQGKAERALVTAIGRERRMRELSATALGAALDALPDALRRGVRARLERRPS
jgi:rhombotail lipoprotein